jgi:hypothetical protein
MIDAKANNAASANLAVTFCVFSKGEQQRAAISSEGNAQINILFLFFK